MPEQTLESLHSAWGATLGEYNGRQIPRFYTDPQEERDQVRRSCGIIDLSNRGQLRIGGRDRQTFLQGMVSNDTRLLEPGKGVYATYLEPKGHMLGDLTLYAFEEFYLADTEPGRAQTTAKTLDRYLIREKVTLKVEDQDFSRIGISGPSATEKLRQLFPTFPELPRPFGCTVQDWRGDEIHVLRRNMTGEEGYLLSLTPPNAVSIWEALTQAGAVPFGQEALEALRIEAGIPRYGVDMNDEAFPLEAGLFFGVSREKGCYIGQEVIERISSRGHFNRRLVPLRLSVNVAPEPGTELFHEGKRVGVLTSAASTPETGDSAGLGYVRKEAWDTGNELTVGEPEGTVKARILARPAYGTGDPPAIDNREWKL